MFAIMHIPSAKYIGSFVPKDGKDITFKSFYTKTAALSWLNYNWLYVVSELVGFSFEDHVVCLTCAEVGRMSSTDGIKFNRDHFEVIQMENTQHEVSA